MKHPLTQIAYTTTWQGGEGVIYARNLLGLEVDDVLQHLRTASTPAALASDEIFIENDPEMVEVFSMDGKLLIRVLATQLNEKKELLPNGIYLLRRLATDGTQHMMKFALSK